MFTILKRNESGELTEVVRAETREEAEKFLKRLQGLFPGDQYELHEVESKAPEQMR